jgi:hypothetical protein
MDPINFHTDTRHHEWLYNSVKSDGVEIKKLRRFLWNNRDGECILYHGTSAEIPVMEQGLKKTTLRTKKSLQSQSGYVYLSTFPSSARMFGEMAYPSKKVVVYQVRICIYELRPDRDQLRNRKVFAGEYIEKEDLATSLAIGHGARVKRQIWPFEIKPTDF